MVETEDMRIRNYEELLWDKVVKMSQAKEQGNDYFFDELLDEAEMLVKLVPPINQKFQEYKQTFDNLLRENIQSLKSSVGAIQDDITRDIVSAQKSTIIKWEYRSDMLEMIFNLLNDFQIIPFGNPYFSEMIASPEPVAEEVPKLAQPVPQPLPQASPAPIPPPASTPTPPQTLQASPPPAPKPKQTPGTGFAPGQRPPNKSIRMKKNEPKQ